MAYTQENIQFSESVVKYNLINFQTFLIDMGSLSGAGRLFHNIGLLNLIDRFQNVDCTEDIFTVPRTMTINRSIKCKIISKYTIYLIYAPILKFIVICVFEICGRKMQIL